MHEKMEQGTHFTGSPGSGQILLDPLFNQTAQRRFLNLETVCPELPFSPCFLWPDSSGPTYFLQRPNMFINAIAG